MRNLGEDDTNPTDATGRRRDQNGLRGFGATQAGITKAERYRYDVGPRIPELERSARRAYESSLGRPLTDRAGRPAPLP